MEGEELRYNKSIRPIRLVNKGEGKKLIDVFTTVCILYFIYILGFGKQL